MRNLRNLAAVLLLAAAFNAAAAEVPYNAAAFQKMLASGQAVAVSFHADWCPTCRAQAPVLRDLAAQPDFKGVTVMVANFDTELQLRKSLNVSQQSTIVVFRSGKEVARSTGDTDRKSLGALLRTAVS